MVTKASFCIFNKHGPKSYSIGKEVHQTNIIVAYINNIYVFDIFFCLINFGKKSCLFGKVTYVTALIWTYFPYMIHQSYHHTPRSYIDSN